MNTTIELVVNVVEYDNGKIWRYKEVKELKVEKWGNDYKVIGSYNFDELGISLCNGEKLGIDILGNLNEEKMTFEFGHFGEEVYLYRAFSEDLDEYENFEDFCKKHEEYTKEELIELLEETYYVYGIDCDWR